MNNLKMLMEEILPFYFLAMVIVILFTGHVPTDFELYIVYAFSFGVAMYNNHLYKATEKMRKWGIEALDVVDVLEKENKKLRSQVASLSNQIRRKKGDVDK